MPNFGGNFMNIDYAMIRENIARFNKENAETRVKELNDLNLGDTFDGASVSSLYGDNSYEAIPNDTTTSNSSFGRLDFGGMDFGFKKLVFGNLNIGKGSINISDDSIKALKSEDFNMTPNLNLTHLKIKLLLMRFKYVIGGLVIVGGYFAYKKFKK